MITVRLPGLNTSTTAGGPEGLEHLDWREVIRLEGLATRKAQAAPRCEVCHRPMLCGQTRAHRSCMD